MTHSRSQHCARINARLHNSFIIIGVIVSLLTYVIWHTQAKHINTMFPFQKFPDRFVFFCRHGIFKFTIFIFASACFVLFSITHAKLRTATTTFFYQRYYCIVQYSYSIRTKFFALLLLNHLFNKKKIR